MVFFLDRKNPTNELEGLEKAQKILDDRYQKGQVADIVYQKQCLEFQRRREKYERKLKKQGKFYN